MAEEEKITFILGGDVDNFNNNRLRIVSVKSDFRIIHVQQIYVSFIHSFKFCRIMFNIINIYTTFVNYIGHYERANNNCFTSPSGSAGESG